MTEFRARGATLAAIVSLGFILCPGTLTAQQPERTTSADREAGGRWTVDDVLTAEDGGDYRISPDNRWIVWVRRRMDRTVGESVSNLWLTDLRSGESIPLTRGQDRNYSPEWSPDGERIAFRSTRSLPGEEGSSGPSRVWVMQLRGGDPWPVATGVRSVRDFDWLRAGSDTLVVAAREDSSHYEMELARAGDDTRVVEDTLTELPVRLWKVPVDEERGQIRVTENRDWIESVEVAPGGDRAVVVAGNDLSFGYDGMNPPHTYLVNLENGSRRTVFTGDSVLPNSIQWAPDRDGFYVSYEYSSHPVYRTASVTKMGYYSLGAETFSPIDLDWSRQLGNGFEVFPGGFVAMLADGVHYRPAIYRRDSGGWNRRLLEGRHVPNIFEWSLSDDGEVIAYTHSEASSPPQPFWARLREGRVEVESSMARLNPDFRAKRKPRAEIVHWEGARGDTVEGLLRYPLKYDPDRRYPLLLRIHGGPASQDLDRWGQSWADPHVLHNQKGAFVLQVNYHGSGNYGLEWVESIGGGNYYDLEVPDLEAGVDYLIDRGQVHPDSLAVGGWSNGGILTIALTVENPDRYKAALAGAGDVEWISDWGNIDFGGTFDNFYMGGPPYEIPERYVDKSPFFRMERVTTPTIIFFGTEDRAVPTGQGWSHYRALQQIGKAPVRFLLFPGEPHGPTEYEYQRRKVEEERAWLKEYLWEEKQEKRRSLDARAPLAAAVHSSSAERSGRLLGIRSEGALQPETVPYPGKDGIRIGRFEVTRAQWKAFRPEYDYPAGTGNHPVRGVDQSSVRAYLDWLSERNDLVYRLPTRTEIERIGQDASDGNTLSYWAGYRPNPDDASRLRQQIAELTADRTVLKAVDEFPPACVDGVCVFGLGGNVAEWSSLQEDGSDASLCAAGEYAVSVPGRGSECDAPRRYTGLRVVAEAGGG